VTQAAALPIVVLPVGVDDAALDACLGALEAGTPAGTRVWLADDAQAGPRARAVIDAWLARTALQAHYTRRQRAVGEVAHLDEIFGACGDSDVVVLASDAQPAPGWLAQLSSCLARDAAIATATPWSNAGEAASWPRIGEIAALPMDLERMAQACASMPPLHAELPGAITHAVALRGSARRRAGGLDATSYGSWCAALIDLSLRMAGLGWRNVLCETTFVARIGEGLPADGDMDALAARWPAWHARLARFLMEDPLHGARAQLSALVDGVGAAGPQRELFA
jgi:hypothetical protein